MIIKIIIAAFAVLVGFRFVYLLKNKAPIAIDLKYHINYILPFVESFFWIGYLIWAARLIYLSGHYFTLISIGTVLIILSVPLYILLRDFFVGNFLKLQNKVSEGSFIEIDEIKGQIIKAGHFRLDIENNHGSTHSIPYYSIRSKIISGNSSNHNLVKVVLRFTFSNTFKVNDIVPKLKNTIINTPWASVTHDPIIENVTTEADKLIVEVGVFTLNKSYGENIQHMVESHLSTID